MRVLEGHWWDDDGDAVRVVRHLDDGKLKDKRRYDNL
jgi:hypothetical protein